MALTLVPGLVSHSVSATVRSKTLTPFSMRGAKGWFPLPAVLAGKAFTPASCIASILSALARALAAVGTAGCGAVAPPLWSLSEMAAPGRAALAADAPLSADGLPVVSFFALALLVLHAASA